MGSGVTSLSTSQKKEPAAAPGPPFPANSAVNGLSVNGAGQIVLGNDVGSFLAMLLNDRQLPLGAFRFDWLNGTDRLFSVDPTNELYQLGDIDGASTGNLIVVENGGVLPVVQLGDPNQITNGSFITVRNGNIGLIDLVTGSALATSYEMRQENDLGNSEGWEFREANSADRYLLLDVLNGLYNIGDIDSSLNGGQFIIDDGNQFISLGSIVGANSSVIELDYSNASMIFAGGGQTMLSLNSPGNVFSIGQILGSGNGNFFQVDDNLSRFNINNILLDAVVNINGVDGFTGTVTPVTSITVIGGIVTAVS